MMTRRATSIANVLNANHADLALVQDFADWVEEEEARIGLKFRTSRSVFITTATKNLVVDMDSQVRILRREVGR